jgi:16S rRNA (adenine1518-N6/adenine1519-N6)-dimethyltransferase
MNLLEKTKQICKDNNIKPARSRGQNFLISEDIYDFIVDSANLSLNDYVLEVGPGLGFLTEKIAKKVKKLTAVELDDKIVEVLRNRLEKEGINNVELINENVLDINPCESYKIIANLPYNITSVFLRKFLSTNAKPKEMTLMLQKEVAERIVAKPGKMSLLAISVQFYAEAKILKYVPKIDFWPVPEVDSALIRIKPHPSPLLKKEREISEKSFFRLVKFGFSAKRKMLKNNLMSGYHENEEKILKILKNCGFNLKIRAQELSLNDWFKLFGEIERNVL